jgi:hypothetical protein
LNPVVAQGGAVPRAAGPNADSADRWTGVWIAEDIEQIAAGVKDRSWVEGTLGVVGGGLDGLALVSDPVGALLQYGIAWLIEHVKPLAEALDWLAGDPAEIAAHAQTWRTVATSLTADADDLARTVRWDIAQWSGAAADAYRDWGAERERSLRTLGTAAETMALMTDGAGMLIGTVRLMVRDAVATVVSRLIVYAGELIATAGLATAWVAEQVTTLCAAWSAKITRWLKDLINSLRRLLGDSSKLGALVQSIKRWLTGGRPGGGESPSGGEQDHYRLASDFDPGRDKGPLGAAFEPGVSDPRGLFDAKERAIAERLAVEGKMVHPRMRIDDVQHLKNPDSMVRAAPDDPGTVTEFKTLESADSGAVRANILRAGKQVDYHGGGDLAIDGREVGLTEEDARRGYARAVGQSKAQGNALPVTVRVIIGDGRIVELP